jgi:hypothetical protein
MSVTCQHPELDATTAGLFPLPLTTFESHLYHDTSRLYPLMCDMEVRLRGRIDRRGFEAGIRALLERSPLCRCVIRRSWWGGLAWTPVDSEVFVDWQTTGRAVEKHYNEQVDLKTEPSLRVYVREGDEQSSVLFHFHHLVSDGIGGLHLIEDFLAGYAIEMSGPAAAVPRDVDTQRLRYREGNILRGVVDVPKFLYQLCKYLSRMPKALVTRKKLSRPPAGRPVFIDLPHEVLENLRSIAQEANVPLNDLLLRDMFVTVCHWNRDRQPSRRRDCVRIIMPQSLRTPEDRRAPPANITSFAALTRTSREIKDSEGLLNSIRTETAEVRSELLTRHYLAGLWLLRKSGLLAFALRLPLCSSTLVLSNLSTPTRRFVGRFAVAKEGLQVGNLVLDRIVAVPYVRPHTHAVFVAIVNRQRLSICARFDRHYLSEAEGQELLQAYVDRLIRSATLVQVGGGP